MFGKRVTGSFENDSSPSTHSTTKSRIAGTGFRIDQAETLTLIPGLPSFRHDGRDRIAVAHEGTGAGDHGLALDEA